MDKFIPYEKLSKKKKRELDLKKRKTWAVSPITRRPENPRAYNRKKARKRDLDNFTDASFFMQTKSPRRIAPPWAVFYILFYDTIVPHSSASVYDKQRQLSSGTVKFSRADA